MKKESAKTTVTEAKLKKLARYELTFEEVFGPEEDWLINVKKRYAVTPEDLLAALDKALTLPPEQMVDEWADPLWNWGPGAYYLFEEEEWSGGVEGYPGLKGEPELTAGIWEDWLTELIMEESWQPEELRRRLQDLIRMREVPVPMRKYEDQVKEQYLLYYFHDNRLQGASEKERLLYVLYADELAAGKNIVGLNVKAAGCFGGDQAYACNWNRARDLYLQLMELDDNPHSAAMLGHLYYGGRVGGGKPDYEKAFYYYSIGAAGGHDEAKLRLSDMFLKGEGVPKNEFIGNKLIWEQYEELLPYVADGVFDTRFPEAAWRAGEAIRRRAEMEEDYYQAFHYLLQAEFALQGRKKIRIGEAEQKLEQDVAWSLKSVGNKLTDLPKASDYLHPDYFFSYLMETYRGKALFSLKYKELAGGKKKLTIRRLNNRGEERPIFLTLAEQESRCLLLDKLDLEVSGITAWEEFAEEDAREIAFNGYEDGCFMLNSRAVLLCAGMWKLKLPKDKK